MIFYIPGPVALSYTKFCLPLCHLDILLNNLEKRFIIIYFSMCVMVGHSEGKRIVYIFIGFHNFIQCLVYGLLRFVISYIA